MKFAVSFFICFSLTFDYSQSKHGFDVGLDSTAFANKLKSKTIVILEIDSTKRDTTWTKKYAYLPDGFVKRYEEIDHEHYYKNDPTNFWKIGYHWIEFEYNFDGYLINEKIQWDGPVNVASYPDTMILTSSKKETYIDKVLREEVLTTPYDTLIKKYNEKGLIVESVGQKYGVRCNYFYHDNGLLKEIITSNYKGIIFSREEYTYEFYQK